MKVTQKGFKNQYEIMISNENEIMSHFSLANKLDSPCRICGRGVSDLKNTTINCSYYLI
jgi:hypothetical protein